MFSGFDNTTGVVRFPCDVNVSGKSQMVALTGNRFEITRISACTQDTNEFSTATHVDGSSNSSVLLRKLHNETGSLK